MTDQTELSGYARALFEESLALKRRVLDEQLDTVVQIAEVLARAIEGGGKVLLCGNGGSAADAQHLAAELLVRLRSDVDREPMPALALGLDTSSLTAHGNDYDFDSYYARMVKALGRPDDVLVAISTSGRSANVVQALAAARERGLTTVGLLGSNGGDALRLCDLALVVPSSTTGRVQEAHITIGHAVLELVELILLERGHLSTVKDSES